MAVVIDSEVFHNHLTKIHDHWTQNRAVWGEADAICIPIPKFDDENDGMYSKTTAVSRYLLGHEFLQTILLLTRNELHILTSDKKVKLLEPLTSGGSIKISLHAVTKDDKNAGNFATLVRAIKGSYHGTRLGIPAKDISNNQGVDGNLASVWLEHAREKAGLAIAEIARGLSMVMVVKDSTELGLVQKAAVMSNKVMKHGFVKEMESIFENENDNKIKHSEMADKLDAIMDDPSKIGIKVAQSTIESCYFPIIQSGGNLKGFNIKPSASTDDGIMTEDVIIVSLGARFKSYCANIARTYVIDDVPTVKRTYATLIRTRAECLAVMQPGSKLSEVHSAASSFLEKKNKVLLKSLPKSLGFSLGLDFKDSNYNLSSKVDPSLTFKPGMVFNLAIGFQDVDIPQVERNKAKGSVKDLGVFSMLVADTVKINDRGIPEVLTKASTEWDDVNYNIKEGDDEEEESGSDAMDEDDKEEDEGQVVKTAAGRATVLKSRLRERVAIGDDQMEAKQKRAEKQQRLHEQARDRGLRNMANGNGGGGGDKDDKVVKAEDFKAYPSSDMYPYESKGNMIHVDMENEAILLPINGIPVPFHVSTIKSVNMPDPDAGAYLRLNFYSPDQALGKDAPPQMAAIVNRFKEGDQTFIKEFTFRSVNPAPLTHAFRQIQELRKRVKQKAIVADQEATLVVQAKLIRLKDQRVPRLADIEMRPALAGRKSKGTIDAHANGLRFTSTKTGEHVDIMYANIKHAFFQPCHSEHIVLIHFHLLNPIMVAKKKTIDIQFITEVVEASEEVTTRGSAYDPDEIESEQRERKMRKALNRKFQEYTVKVEEVAKKHGFDSLEFDIPYKDLAFQGTPNREMVTLQPSVHCLVNLTETPAFVVSMTNIEHIHFERCTMGAKNFDMVFVPKKHSEPVRMVSMINMKDFDDIQEWCTQQDITFTIGTVNFNWKQTMTMVDGFLEDGTFWEDEDEDGESKPPGWLFLNAGTGESDEEEEDDDDSDAQEYKGSGGSDESESESDSDEEVSDDSFDDEDDDESDYDKEEEEEADGQDWDELEREAKASDRQREAWEVEEDKKSAPPAKKSRRR